MLASRRASGSSTHDTAAGRRGARHPIGICAAMTSPACCFTARARIAPNRHPPPVAVVTGGGTYMASTTDVIPMFRYTYGTERLVYLAAPEIVLWRSLPPKEPPRGRRGPWNLRIQEPKPGVW